MPFLNAYGRLLREFVAVLAKQLSPQTLMGYLRQLGRNFGTGKRRMVKAQRNDAESHSTCSLRWAASRR